MAFIIKGIQVILQIGILLQSKSIGLIPFWTFNSKN
jgi:hypothetical protein